MTAFWPGRCAAIGADLIGLGPGGTMYSATS
jgi:hypothetical protein